MPDHSAVPVPMHSSEATVLAPVSWLATTPATPFVATTDAHAILVHPEKALARLHVLQI